MPSDGQGMRQLHGGANLPLWVIVRARRDHESVVDMPRSGEDAPNLVGAETFSDGGASRRPSSGGVAVDGALARR